MTHTEESLSSLTDRELDGIAAEVVFGWTMIERRGSLTERRWNLSGLSPKPSCRSRAVPVFTSWQGLGQVLTRMHELGWCCEYTVDDPVTAEMSEIKFWHTLNDNDLDKDLETETGPAILFKGPQGLPRAAAIAAVLALQTAKEEA